MTIDPIRIQEIVDARGRMYGHPRENFKNIAAGWSVILGTEVTPQQVALCNVWQKVAREVNKHDMDNLLDIIGYTVTLDMLEE